ncbi:hypothetical protein EXN66_Car008776 [Channa argus]|uniref:Uncharacterized protein n=1 Tax=Channa argus TaxID=215402 RepID=A0A6G1PS20_CHAAH|nr:hypothetical protein EXN66_Car008776 [Channa argus]
MRDVSIFQDVMKSSSPDRYVLTLSSLEEQASDSIMRGPGHMSSRQWRSFGSFPSLARDDHKGN